MNRREFIKSLGLVTAAGAAAAVPATLLKEGQPPPIEPVAFDKATLQRWTDGRWQLDFEAEKVFNPSGKNDLVVEIGELKLLLKNMGKVDYSWELTDKGKNYIHWLTGDGWEILAGEDTPASLPTSNPLLPRPWWEQFLKQETDNASQT